MGQRFTIIKRSEWGARDPKERTPLALPVPTVVLHRTGGKKCDSKESCKEMVKLIQENQMDEYDMPDIKWNFIISRSGDIFEGRGWETKAEHVNDEVDAESIAVTFIGKFYDTDSEADEEMLEACRGLMYYGVRHGYLANDLKVVPHAELGDTYCPGLAVLDAHNENVMLKPSRWWRKTTIFGRLWDKISGVKL